MEHKLEHKLQEQAAELIETKTSLLKKIFCIALALAITGVGVWLVYEYRIGTFRDVDSFKAYVDSFGMFGPVLLTLFQCVKTIYAVIPSTLGCIVGPALFGTWTGIICNYIGICSGSFAAFWLSRKFGISLVKQLFSEKRFERSMNRMKRWRSKYAVFLWVAILSPIAPDDFLCYFTGLTGMSFKRFALIILTAKPFTIIVYGLIFGSLFN
ncbi:MAG: TVP38/TMEM64 family protein [Treponema sp.]|nr:TVP38/TMEM64 family protein [Treponema sp.]